MIITRSTLSVAATTAAACLVGGCIAGSLASNTGPMKPAHKWSTASRQMVCAGEEVEFDFVLVDLLGRLVTPLGLADYCVTLIGAERIEVEPDEFGHFRFSHRFDDVNPGNKIKVKTFAYHQRAGRDFMKVAGEWLQSESPYELPDRKIAGDTVRFTVYEAVISLQIAVGRDDFVPSTGVLRIRRSDGSSRSIYIVRPGRPGFSLTGPDTDGLCHVHYMPRGNELSQTGETTVEFTIYDRAGQPHRVSTTIETP